MRIKKLDTVKFGVHIAVAATVSVVTRRFIGEHTEVEADSIPAHIAGALTGEIVASQTDRLTDPAIDIIAARFTRKNNESNETTTAATAE